MTGRWLLMYREPATDRELAEQTRTAFGNSPSAGGGSLVAVGRWSEGARQRLASSSRLAPGRSAPSQPYYSRYTLEPSCAPAPDPIATVTVFAPAPNLFFFANRDPRTSSSYLKLRFVV